MEQRQLGRSGLIVSRLALGTMTFGSQTDEATAAEMIAVSADAGITMIDTANVYNGGAAEEILGRVLGRHRDEMLLATKVGIRSSDAGDAAPLSATAIRMWRMQGRPPRLPGSMEMMCW